MITLCAKTTDPTFKQWSWADDILRKNMVISAKKLWNKDGYDGISRNNEILKYFGVSRIYRGDDSYMRYEFTEEQWTMFILRWS